MQESHETGTQSRGWRADEPRARTGATPSHRRRTFTCKSRRIVNGGAPHVCDVIHDERRQAPGRAPRRGPREGRSCAACRRMATPLPKTPKHSLANCPRSAHPVGDSGHERRFHSAPGRHPPRPRRLQMQCLSRVSSYPLHSKVLQRPCRQLRARFFAHPAALSRAPLALELSAVNFSLTSVRSE